MSKKQKKIWYVGLNARPYVDGPHGDSESNEPYSHRGTTTTHWTIYGITVSSTPGYGLLPIEAKQGQVVYIVYAVWSTGDSFGTDTDRNCEAMSVFLTREKAESYKQQLLQNKSEDSFLPWNGYFESLSYIEIVSGIV